MSRRRSCGTARRRERLAQVDRAALVQREQALVERLHPVVLAVGDDLLDLVRLFRVHDLVEHPARRDEHLDGRHPPGAVALSTSRWLTMPRSEPATAMRI